MNGDKVISTFDASDTPLEKCPRCGSRHTSRVKTSDGWIKQCHDCRKKWPVEAPQEFQGELMTCCMCGQQQLSSPDRNTDWRIIQFNRQNYYVCTEHFPPDEASAEDFSEAYKVILRHIQGLRANG